MTEERSSDNETQESTEDRFAAKAEEAAEHVAGGLLRSTVVIGVTVVVVVILVLAGLLLGGSGILVFVDLVMILFAILLCFRILAKRSE